MKDYFYKHKTLGYFLLTFVISWGLILLVALPSGFPASAEASEELFPLALVGMLLGPLLAGVGLKWLYYGREGFKEFWRSMSHWRLSPWWYVVAFLGTPLLVCGLLLLMSLYSTDFLPAIVTAEGKGTLILTGILVGIMAGLLEEPGWTGFATPELRKKFGVLKTGLIMGFMWGLWHVLVTVWASGDASGALSFELLIPPLLFYIMVLPVFRVLMVWLYDQTQSLLLSMIMHGSLTGSTVFILEPSTEMNILVPYYLILTGVLWGVYVVIRKYQAGRARFEHTIKENQHTPTSN